MGSEGIRTLRLSSESHWAETWKCHEKTSCPNQIQNEDDYQWLTFEG